MPDRLDPTIIPPPLFNLFGNINDLIGPDSKLSSGLCVKIILLFSDERCPTRRSGRYPP
jgi:hypothetical protein